MALLLALGLLSATNLEARTIPLLVAIGDNLGDPTDLPLRFAVLDAQRIQELFVDIGGVSPERAYLVVNQPAPIVRQKLAEVAGRIAELTTAGNDVVLTLYVSAHAKAGELHLSGTHLSLAELREFAANSKARVRVLFVDACDSGAIARQKGATAGPEYEVSLETMPLRGQVMISSSGPAEPSQEWGSLKGSLFTHHLLAGLRGDADADGDGNVTFSEAYAYAYRRTVAEGGRQLQHPVSDLDLAGTGELVLTIPAAARNALIFPEALEGSYVVVSRPRPDFVVEVQKRMGKRVRIAVPAGRYQVRKQLGNTVGLMDVELPYGGERTIDESNMARRHFSEVAAKGDYVELRPHAMMVLGSLGTPALSGSGARWLVGIGYRHSWGDLWGLARVAFGATQFRGVDLSTSEQSLSAGLAAGYRWIFSPLIFRTGLAFQLDGFRESYDRDQEAAIQRVFGTGHLPGKYSLGFAGGPLAEVEVPLPWSAFVLAQVEALARSLPAQNQSRWTIGAQGYIGVGKNF